MHIKENNLSKWSGSHEGVNFEINYWKDPETKYSEARENWTYYIFIFLDRLPEGYENSFWLKGGLDEKGKRVNYDYYSHLPDIYFHGGVTYYSKESGFEGEPKVVKIGCDFQHYWDEGHHYDLESVKYEVKKTIESIYKLIPDYKY